VVELYESFKLAEADEHTAQGMLADPQMKGFAEAEIREARERMAAIEVELQKLLLPKDPNDERNTFLEIRAGTGGDESALFAGDLFRMYTRFGERNRWQVEVISASSSEVGGYKEVIARSSARVCFPSSSSNPAATGAARACDRNAGAHPHLRLHRCR